MTLSEFGIVPVLVLLFFALWFILRGDLLYVLPCVILFLCFSVLLVLRLPRLGKRELILELFVRLFDLFLFGFVVSSSSWCLGRAAVCDCGTPWTFLLPFFVRFCVYRCISSVSLYVVCISCEWKSTFCMLWCYPKVRKGVLFAKRSPFRKKDYPKMRKGLLFA